MVSQADRLPYPGLSGRHPGRIAYRLPEAAQLLRECITATQGQRAPELGLRQVRCSLFDTYLQQVWASAAPHLLRLGEPHPSDKRVHAKIARQLHPAPRDGMIAQNVHFHVGVLQYGLQNV